MSIKPPSCVQMVDCVNAHVRKYVLLNVTYIISLYHTVVKAAKTKNASIVSNGAARVGGLRDTSIMLFAAAYALMLIVHLL